MSAATRAQRRAKRRAVLVETQGGDCAYCFGHMDPPMVLRDPYNWRAATMDEVFPRSKGGRLAGNTVAVHAACNTRKDNRPPTGCELIALAWVNAKMVERPTFIEDRVAMGLPRTWKAFKQWKWLREKDRSR